MYGKTLVIPAIMALLKFRKEFARRPYTTLSEISDFMKVTAMRESMIQLITGFPG
jgi:hypothetical protein